MPPNDERGRTSIPLRARLRLRLRLRLHLRLRPLSLRPPLVSASQPTGCVRNGKSAESTSISYLQRQREDFARKQASALISSHDLIALEDLPVRHLVRNRHLAKAISDVGWARFRRWVEYYGNLHLVPVIAIPPHYTSQDCSSCGTRVQKSLSVRTHICPRCGLILDRDENAAVNIRERGLALAREHGKWV